MKNPEVIYAYTNLAHFHRKYEVLHKAELKPDWKSKIFGATEVFYVILNLPK